MLLLTGTPVLLLAGFTLETSSAVLSATPDAPVVKVLVKGVTTFPATSVKPDAVTI